MSRNGERTFSEAVLSLGRGRARSRSYVIHQAVADLLGDRDDRGYLFYDIEGDATRSRILILSDAAPSGPLPPESPCRLEALRSKPYSLGVAPGADLDFEIHINATRVVTDDEGNKKRKDVWDAVWSDDPETEQTPHEVYRTYLERKLDGVATVEEARVIERGPIRVRGPRHNRPIFLVAATVIGRLSVQRPAGLEERIVRGFGRAKAFGCGLLCLSRPGTVLPRRHPGSVAHA